MLVTLRDPQPTFEPRDTTRGWRTINARLLDAKTQYRQWTERFQVHSTETARETNRDLSMLLGLGADGYVRSIQDPWNGQIERLEQDLVGARGWQSLSELFWVLNRSVDYVAVDSDAPLPRNQSDLQQRNIDLITDKYWAVHALSSTRQHPPTAPNGGRFSITVGGANFKIGIRFVGDGYYDPAWEKEILKTRVLDQRGFYRPSNRDCFQALAYHSLMHKAAPGDEDKAQLVAMASNLHRKGWTQVALDDPSQAKALLDQLMRDHGCSYTEPLDRTVFYNRDFLQERRSPIRRLTTDLHRQIALVRQKWILPLLAGYWRGRDRLLWRFPVLRTVMMWGKNLK